MPELPEVETIVRKLKPKVLNRTFIDVWIDTPKIVKKPNTFGLFKKQVRGKKILNIWRKGKNIIFDLSEGNSLLVHQKMTGHLLSGKWKIRGKKWESIIPGPLKTDPNNRFLHLIFWLDNGEMLALSDLRKFAKVELWPAGHLAESKSFKGLGPDPLDKDFSFGKFSAILKDKKGKIKQVLMDQNIISGIGNIYSDEILWESKIHPFKDVSGLSFREIGRIYRAIKKILFLALKLGGTSISDYRMPSGERGLYDKIRKVYRREGIPCPRKDGGTIKRAKIGGRSAHFCPVCQKL